MVPRRTHEAQSRFVLTGKNAIDRVTRSAGRKPCDVERIWTHDRIGVEMPAASRGHCSDVVDVSRFVNPLESRAGGWLPLRARALSRESGRFEPGGNLPEARGPLGMVARVVVQKPGIVVEECHAVKRGKERSRQRKKGLI